MQNDTPTSKTPKMKKCPIFRANIVHFDTFALYQNVSYKMSHVRGFNTILAHLP